MPEWLTARAEANRAGGPLVRHEDVRLSCPDVIDLNTCTIGLTISHFVRTDILRRTGLKSRK